VLSGEESTVWAALVEPVLTALAKPEAAEAWRRDAEVAWLAGGVGLAACVAWVAGTVTAAPLGA